MVTKVVEQAVFLLASSALLVSVEVGTIGREIRSQAAHPNVNGSPRFLDRGAGHT